MGGYDAEQMAQAQHASQLSYQRESRVGGSSHAVYGSSTSYQPQPILGDSRTVALRSEKLNPSMLDSAPVEAEDLPKIEEFKQITHKRKKFFVVGKVRSS